MEPLSLDELAELARDLGYDRQRCLDRLERRIARDQAYLEYRRKRGRRTSHDEVVAEDMVAMALLLVLLWQEKGKGV